MKRLLFYLIVLLHSKPAQDGLYDHNEFVQVLNKDNFHEQLKNRSELWLVEFYASWCGHCVHFAPTIKEFAKDVRHWSRLFQFGVIDCGNNENTEICSENKINGFPTVKYFPPGPRNFTAKNVVSGRTVAAMRGEVLNLIVANEPKLPDVALGVNFNDIANLSELEEFLANVKAAEKFKFVAIVIGLKSESKAGYGSRDLVADFSTFGDVAICRSDSSAEVAEKYEIAESAAAVVVLDPTNGKLSKTFAIPDDETKSRDEFFQTIVDELELKAAFPWTDRTNSPPKEAKADGLKSELNWKQFDQSKIYMQDVESALLHLLFHDVIDFPLEGDSLDSLKVFVATISAVYPSTSRNVDAALKSLTDRIANASRVKKRKEWISHLNESGLTKLQGENPKLTFAACTPSVENRRGYTCGLWTAFHFLLNRAGDDACVAVARAFSNVLLHHFNCLHCRENFKQELKMFPIETITDADSANLWLWSLHNSVNKRLAGDETEDPEFPKIQFPSSADCPTCVKSEGGFVTEQVAVFLKAHFALENAVLFEDEVAHESTETRIEVEDEEEIIPPAKVRLRTGWIWFSVVVVTVALLWSWRTYRMKWRLRRSYHKFKHQM